MSSSWKGCVLLLGWALALHVASQDPTTKAIPTFRILGIKDDLPQGNDWVDHDHLLGLPAKRINHLLLEPAGGGHSVWVATGDQGLAPWQNGRWERWDPWIWWIGNRYWWSIVKALAEYMGGAIEFVSDLGHGARFTVRLPLAPASQPGDEGSAN